MATLPEITAAPRTITLAGKAYTARPLTWSDWGEFTAWCQDRFLAKEARLAAHLDDDARRAHMAAVMDRARVMDETSPEVKAQVETLGGISQLVWLSVRGSHPELTRDAIANALFDAAARTAAIAKFNEANFAGLPADQGGGTGASVEEKKTDAVT